MPHGDIDFADVDCEHAKTLRLMGRDEKVESGKLVAAGFAPRREEMDKRDITTMAGKGHAAAAQRAEFEWRHGAGGPRLQTRGSRAAWSMAKHASKTVALMT